MVVQLAHPRRPHTCCWIDARLIGRSSRATSMCLASASSARSVPMVGRHRFHNDAQIVDLGLRLSDVEALSVRPEILRHDERLGVSARGEADRPCLSLARCPLSREFLRLQSHRTRCQRGGAGMVNCQV